MAIKFKGVLFLLLKLTHTIANSKVSDVYLNAKCPADDEHPFQDV